MAIFKIITRKPRTLHGIIFHINDVRTHSRDDKSGIADYQGLGVDITRAAKDFALTKVLLHQRTGNMYQHLIVSVTEEESIKKNLLKLCRIATRIGNYIYHKEQCQIVWAIHTNTENYHIHFLVNSVRLNGEKYSINWATLNQYKVKFSEFLIAEDFEGMRMNEYEKEYAKKTSL